MSKAPSARLFFPSPSIASRVFVGVTRDTRGLVLSDRQRFNYYPATPMSLISWFFEGAAHLVEECTDGKPSVLGPPLPRLSISGPRRSPTISWSPGPVHAMTVAFFPESLARLIGTAPERLPGRSQALENVATSLLLSVCQMVMTDPGLEPFQRFAHLLEPLWTGPRASETRTVALMTDWVRSHIARAASSKPGRGMRQFQRLIKTWTGQSNRELQLFARTERAFLLGVEGRAEGRLDLAGIAASAGYADQSHLSREIRRVTGLSPGRLDEMIANEEPFWFYRLIAEQFGGW